MTTQTSPKLKQGEPAWYSYYAGFSLRFAHQALLSLELAKGARVLDPWSGSGTTLVGAREANLRSLGVDANPALVVVSKGRTLGSEVKESLPALAEELIQHAQDDAVLADDDPLTQWADVASAGRLRAYERSIQKVLVGPGAYIPIRLRGVQTVSSLAAFFYVVAFDVARRWALDARSSNPTWFRRGVSHRISVSWADLAADIRRTQARLSASIATRSHRGTDTRVLLGSSTALPCKDASFQAALTSPPYLTRIDYVIATLPELAVLGYSRADAELLRDTMIGTPTISSTSIPDTPAEWGPAVKALLDAVRTHQSKASASYYLKTFIQYFDAMSRSIHELGRVVEPGGTLLLVVQDSFYKEIRVDLAALLTEIACRGEWVAAGQTDFTSSRSLAVINPRVRQYRSSFATAESVVWLRRKQVS